MDYPSKVGNEGKEGRRKPLTVTANKGRNTGTLGKQNEGEYSYTRLKDKDLIK